ncbi:MAG: hypothetical protein ABIP74_00520 [Candidatus Saccharimonas sp.]
MNIYLDIDGVLLANESSAALYADELLQAVLKEYPDSTYWLTTHNWNGENRAIEVLAPHLKPETVALLDKVKPTEWNELKTDAIDFSQKFLWLDDDLWEGELKELEKHNATDNFILIDLAKDPNQLKTIVDLL